MEHDIKQTIIKDFSKAWTANDRAHQLGHFCNVEECGLVINERLGLGFDEKLITMVAFFHDMFAWSRFNHHEMSGTWVETTDYPLVVRLTKEDRQLVATACRQHRASFQGTFDNKFAELMHAADRELPKSVESMIERAVRYRMSHGDSREQAMKPAIEHIKGKYGDGGYGRHPEVYLQVFGDELKELKATIRNL